MGRPIESPNNSHESTDLADGSGETVTGDVSRRRILQTAGAASIGTAVLPSYPATAASLPQDWEHVGRTTFVESGLKHDTGAVGATHHIDHIRWYRVDQTAGKLRYYMRKGEQRFADNDLMINGINLEEGPTTLFESRESRSLPISLTRSLNPHRHVRLAEPYTFPRVRVDQLGDERIQITAIQDGAQATLGPNESTAIQLSDRTVTYHSGEEDRVIPSFEVRNHGTLDVYVNAMEGSQ